MPDDFIHTFLFGDYNIQRGENQIRARVRMDASKEGWVGIPHGGIGMGAITELGRMACADLKGPGLPYPLKCSFRMGGADARMGDEVEIAVTCQNPGFTGRISARDEALPYITGDFSPAGGAENEPMINDIPASFSRMEGALVHLPQYRNCFVCGMERAHPGLKRRFHLLDTPRGAVVCAFAGFDPEEDCRTILRFHRNGWLHPMVHFAALDETMGWAGFFKSANGGVSVRLQYILRRKIGIDEKLVYFGRGERVKGRIDKRMMFWASGCGAVMAEDGAFEVVMTASGQWFVLPALTDQMRTELLPEELTRRAFAIAEARQAS